MKVLEMFDFKEGSDMDPLWGAVSAHRTP